MSFSQDAIDALNEKRIKPFCEIETKLSHEGTQEPWHKIRFSGGRLIHDANEIASELTLNAIDPDGFAVDPFRADDDTANHIRTGSLIRLKLGITYTNQGSEITEYRIAFLGFITRLNPYVDSGFWGVEVTAHDKSIRLRDAVAKIKRCADIIRVDNEHLSTLDNKIYHSVNPNWIPNMVVLRRTVYGETHEVHFDEYQVLERAGGIEFFNVQDIFANIYADYHYYDGSALNVSEVMRDALEYPSESGGVGVPSQDYDIADTSQSNPDESQRLPLIRFNWDELDGGPIEIYNYLLNAGAVPSNLKFWFDSEDNKYRMHFIYQKDLTNPKTPGFTPDLEVVRSIAFDDPADSEELYTRVIVIGKRHAPINLARNGTVMAYALPPHPGWKASFDAPLDNEGASNTISNINDGSVNTQYMWILGNKVGEHTADGAIIAGTETSSMPQFDQNHPYNEIAPVYLDLGQIKKPSRVAVHIGSNRFGNDRNPGRPPMLVSIEVAKELSNPDDMHDPGWLPLSAKAFRVFCDANLLFELDRNDFVVDGFRYIRVIFHFGLYYKWKPSRRFIEYPIREIAVFDDDIVTGTDQVSELRYPGLFERYQRRGYRTYIHHDSSLQTQEQVNQRAHDLLDELVRSYIDRETLLAWDPRFRLHAPKTIGEKTIYGLTVTEIDPRYGTSDSRLVTRIEYDLENFIVKISGTDYFGEAD